MSQDLNERAKAWVFGAPRFPDDAPNGHAASCDCIRCGDAASLTAMLTSVAADARVKALDEAAKECTDYEAIELARAYASTEGGDRDAHWSRANGAQDCRGRIRLAAKAGW